MATPAYGTFPVWKGVVFYNTILEGRTYGWSEVYTLNNAAQGTSAASSGATGDLNTIASARMGMLTSATQIFGARVSRYGTAGTSVLLQNSAIGVTTGTLTFMGLVQQNPAIGLKIQSTAANPAQRTFREIRMVPENVTDGVAYTSGTAWDAAYTAWSGFVKARCNIFVCTGPKKAQTRTCVPIASMSILGGTLHDVGRPFGGGGRGRARRKKSSS